MRRILTGAAIGVVVTLLLQYGHNLWRSCQWRHDAPIMEWQYERLPVILGADNIYFIESQVSTFKWPLRKYISSLLLYEKENSYKIIHIDIKVDEGNFTFPSEAEIRDQDEGSVGIPIYPQQTTNAIEIITSYSFPTYLLRKILRSK